MKCLSSICGRGHSICPLMCCVGTLAEGVPTVTHPSFLGWRLFAVLDLCFHGCGFCADVKILDRSTDVF